MKLKNTSGCKCRLCRWSKEIDHFAKKMSPHDRNRFNMLMSAIWDDNEENSMQIANMSLRK